MQFPTLAFAAFFTVVLSAYWLLRPWRLLQKWLLLIVSYVFCTAFDWRFSAVLLVSSVVFYIAGEGIARCTAQSAQRAWLIAGISINVLLLCVFKYYNFFVDSLDQLAAFLGLRAHLPVLEVLLPIGISFYVFQGIAYIADLYWKRGVRAGSLLDFLLFQAFFLRLIAGPICRSRELPKEIMAPTPEKVPDVSRAASLILSGLMKKAVLGHFIDTHLVLDVFAAPENYTAPTLWMGMLGYTLLIYWDFSGYTDLVRGLGLLLGFRIPENFEHPYVATDIADFWRRWHITLSFWIRDYLFFPMGGMHLNKRWGALVGSMLLCGLWHGAGWTFVLWGGYHGLLLLAHHWLRTAVKIKWRGGWWGRAGTLVLVMFGWVLFNSPDLAGCWLYVSRMFIFNVSGMGFELLAALVIALGLVLHITGPRIRHGYIALSERLPWGWRPVLWFATGMAMLALKPSGIAPYLYGTF